MKIYLERASVSMNDDINAPHAKEFEAPEGISIERIIKNYISSGYLPLVAGGHATWSVFSNIPIAIIAQEWLEPKMFFTPMKQLDIQNDTIRLFVNYHAQTNPDTVYKVFWGLQLKAS
jgi:hypothetical protein